MEMSRVFSRKNRKNVAKMTAEKMADFELDLMNMVRKLRFRKVNNVIQEQLKSDNK